MSIADKLVDLNNIKGEIRTAIIAKGVPVPEETPFREYDDKIALISGGGGGGGDEDPPVVDWVRPSDWMAMPSMLVTDDKVVMLIKVSPKSINANRVFFSGIGNVGIEWGDGSADYLGALGSTSAKFYDYADLSANPYIRENVFTVEFTTTDTSTTITTAAPVLGIRVGMLVVGAGIPDHTFIEEILTGTSYRITNAATASATVDLELTDEYFRQALCTITATSTITRFYVSIAVNINDATKHISPVISMKASLPNISGATYLAADVGYGKPTMVQEIELISYGRNDVSSLFHYGYSLRKVILPNLSHVAYFTNMFSYCISLEKIDTTIDISGAILLNQMFYFSYALKEVTFNTTTLPGGAAGVQARNNMFQDCVSMTKFPFTEIGPDTSSVGNSASLLAYCRSLRVAPKMTVLRFTSTPTNFMFECNSVRSVDDTTEITVYFSSTQGLNSFCYNNYALREFPDLVLGGANFTASYIFFGCMSLERFPKITSATGGCTTYLQAAYGCRAMIDSADLYLSTTGCSAQQMFYRTALHESPNIGRGQLSGNCSGMFGQSSAMESLKHYDTSLVTNIASFVTLTIIKHIPAYDLSGCTSAIGLISPGSVSVIDAYGFTRGMDITNHNMSREEIVRWFENAGTASGSQTLTYNGNLGTADITAADKLIATDKGWTLNPA